MRGRLGIGGLRGLRIPEAPDAPKRIAREPIKIGEREPEFTIPSFDYDAPTIDQDAINKALEAITVRKDANDAKNNATDQYEADVADFKDIQASEIEQGIASLPEILELAQEPFVDEGLGSFTPAPRDKRLSESVDDRGVPIWGSRETPPTDIDERDFIDTIGDAFIPQPETSLPVIPDELELPPFVKANPSIPWIGNPVTPLPTPEVADPIIPPMPNEDSVPFVPPAPVLDIDERDFIDSIQDDFGLDFYNNQITEPFVPSIDESFTPSVIPNVDIPSGNPYTDIFDIDERDFWDSIDIDPDDWENLPPYLPDDPIVPDPIVPDPIVPDPSEPGMTPFYPEEQPVINYYTGKPLSNPYTPYSTDSGTAPLTRKMTPQQFGQAPGFPATPPRLPNPRLPIIKPPDKRRDDQIFVPPKEPPRMIAMAPAGAKGGGYLNKGISMLPMNGQGDTLTTQVFQSGFRPRR